jgi:hypothetical protein
VFAASEVANAVPFTEAVTSAIAASTCWADPVMVCSFARAWSMASRRLNPAVRVLARTAPAATPAPTTPALSVLPMPADSFDPIDWPDVLAVFSAAPNACLMPGAILLVSGTMET